jgi:hypothetical protein
VWAVPLYKVPVETRHDVIPGRIGLGGPILLAVPGNLILKRIYRFIWHTSPAADSLPPYNRVFLALNLLLAPASIILKTNKQNKYKDAQVE